jgi:hypothetical protein
MVLLLVEKRGTNSDASPTKILFQRIKYASNCMYRNFKTRKQTEATATDVLACNINPYIKHPLASYPKKNIYYYIRWYYLENWLQIYKLILGKQSTNLSCR